MSRPPREPLRAVVRRLGPAFALLLALQGLLVVLYRALARPRDARPSASRVERLGGLEPAPDVSPLRLDGATVPLRSLLRHHSVLVHFWATWCSPCRREIPALLDLARARPAGVQVVLVAVRDDPEALRRFFDGSAPREVLLDPSGDIAHRFGVASLPDSFAISRAGRLTHRARGPLDWRGPAALRLCAEAARTAP